MAIAALPFAIFGIGGDAAQVGLLLAGESLSIVLLLLLGGVIADRWQRSSVMIVGDLLRAVSYGAITVLLLCGIARPWQLFALLVLSGAGTALFQPAASGLMPALVPADLLRVANGINNVVLASTAIVGPLVAGTLMLALSPGWAFALNSMIFAAGAVLLKGLSVVGPSRPPLEPAALHRELAQGWREFRTHSWLWTIVVEFSLLNAFAIAPFAVIGAVVAEHHFGGPGAWSLILIAAGVGEIAGCLLAMSWRVRRGLFWATLGVASWVAPLILLAMTAPLPAIVVAVVPAGASLGHFATIWDTTLHTHLPETQLSRLSSFDWFGSLAMLPLGYLFAGWAQAAVGPTATLVGAAGLVLLSTAAAVARPSVRNLGLQMARVARGVTTTPVGVNEAAKTEAMPVR